MTELPRQSDGLVEVGVLDSCPWGDRHLPTVTYSRRLRDAFRRRYWVRCWECPMRLGPFGSPKEADNCRRDVEQIGALRTVLKLEGIPYTEKVPDA